MKKIRVLHIVSGLDIGGVGVMLYNYYTKMNRDKIQFDFITYSGFNGMVEKKFKKQGSLIHQVPSKKKNIKEYFNLTNKIINNGEYDIIHVHQNHLSFVPLFLAKKAKIKYRIAHSHGYESKLSLKRRIVNNLTSYLVKKYANHYFSCSTEAGEWLFGKKMASKNEIIQIKNAINLDEFTYNYCFRKHYREKYSLQGQLVLVQIGRFTPEKNHIFTIKVFEELLKENPESILIFIGDNNVNLELKNIIDKNNLMNNIKFLGKLSNVNEVLSACDALIMPSIHEGLGIVAIEGQASGLKCFVSDRCSKDLKVTDLIEYISLESTHKLWAEKIHKSISENRRSQIDKLTLAGYEIKEAAEYLNNTYMKIISKESRKKNEEKFK